MKDKVEFFILFNQIVDIFTFIFLGAEDLSCLLGDADADGVGALGGRATLGEFVITHWCKPLDRGAVGLKVISNLKQISSKILLLPPLVAEAQQRLRHE